MEQNTLQLNSLNNVHESDFSGFINNGLQQPTNVIQAERSSTNPNNNLGVSSYNTNNVPATYVNTQINSPFNSPEILPLMFMIIICNLNKILLNSTDHLMIIITFVANNEKTYTWRKKNHV